MGRTPAQYHITLKISQANLPAHNLVRELRKRKTNVSQIIKELLAGRALSHDRTIQDVRLAQIVECRRRKKVLQFEEREAVELLKESGMSEEEIDAEIGRRMY